MKSRYYYSLLTLVGLLLAPSIQAAYTYRFVNTSDQKITVTIPFSFIEPVETPDAVCPEPKTFTIEPSAQRDLISTSNLCLPSLGQLKINGKTICQYTRVVTQNTDGEVWYLKPTRTRDQHLIPVDNNGWTVDIHDLYLGIINPIEIAYN